ncbi:Bax inhibitor-1/YccA family protein [Catenuloplanes indicus]|uniref:YccA/Bax inhibitor family protein n=1 Tax=Catenuloplanes indicus TaxID=137267 RepID=A0AAE3W0B5_9ACTN|nr:Bax inhibitor-1/YccA family protein [Catenuloplanes indicus]MDQ0367001.1 putative YccA/Bax inhibitor family protein [Catenuloplanes indicus]
MKTSNPVLSQLGRAAERERAGAYGAYGPGGAPGYGPAGYDQPYPSQAYPAAPPAVRPMTIDDVVVRTVALLAITALSAAAAWILVPAPVAMPVLVAAAVVGLVLGLVLSFMRMANPVLTGVYAVVQGVLLGLVSRVFEGFYDGIVLQATTATFGVFFLMAILYRARVIRATPKFARIMISIMVGLFAVMMINLVFALFGVNTGLRDGSPLAIGFSLVCIVVASLSFVLNFGEIEEGVRMGLPQKYAWTAAFGILVGLIWLYLEILRLLSFLQDD